MNKSATQTTQPAAKSLAPMQGVLQRKCDCGNHTVAGGECAECGKEKNAPQRKVNNQKLPGENLLMSGIPVMQRKLTIGASIDPLEQEADRVADQVLAAPTYPAVISAAPRIQRFIGQVTSEASTAPTSVDRVLASPGRPLDPVLQQDMGQRFGHDFSRVRVHSGTVAEQSARDVNANAYTVGHNIVFGAGRLAPGTHDGRRLIAHELTHVVQQSGADATYAGQSCKKCSLSPISTSAATIQRQPASPDAAIVKDEEVTTSGLIAEDTVNKLRSGQMKKSEFLAELRTELCRTAEAALAGTGRTSSDCPYLDFWFSYYSKQDSQHIERSIRRYAPETANAATARGLTPLIAERVRRGIEVWARTGKITGVPADLPTNLSGAGSAQDRTNPSSSSIQFKGRDGGARNANNPQAIQEQLGNGYPLNGGVRSRMESAYGRSFSQVRVHTDATAAALSDRLNARAFTVGEHVAFGSNEYRPGSLIGDAIIAHELAHVIQQGSSSDVIAPVQMEQGSYDKFEEDADQSAMAATLSLWGRTKRVLNGIPQYIKPRLKSGLQLQACRRTVLQCPRGLRWAVVGQPTATGPVCVCAWRCLPPGAGFSLYSVSGGSSGPSVSCANRDRFGRCPGAPDYETVDDDYEIRNQGTVVGVGAHMSPLGAQAACGCLPLDIKGDPTGEQQVHAPLLSPGLDITNLAGMRGNPARDLRTGVIAPGGPTTTPPPTTRRPTATTAPPTPGRVGSTTAGGATGGRPAGTAPAPARTTPAAPGVTPTPAGTTPRPVVTTPAASGTTLAPATTTAAPAGVGPQPPTRMPGQGITVRGRVQWGNPASRPAYGHSQSEHGARRPARELQDRANSTGDLQGQYSDNRFIIEAEQRAPLTPGAHDVPMGQPVGRVYVPNGPPIENVTTVRVVRKQDLTVRTSFPIN